MPSSAVPSNDEIVAASSAKQRRRERISHVATVLFLERGFDEVSIAEIAAAAGVSKMTVTNHFPLKEDLVFDQFPDELRRMGDVLEGARSIGEVVDAVERYCIRHEQESPVARAIDEEYRPDAWPQFARMVLGSRTLTQCFHAHYREMRRLVGDALPRTLGENDAATAAWLTAETLHFVQWWPIEAVGRGVPPASIKKQWTPLRERAFATLRHGVGARP